MTNAWNSMRGRALRLHVRGRRPVARQSSRVVALSLLVAMGMGMGVTVLPASASTNSAAVAMAKKVLIVRSDFPSGWTTSPGDNSNSNLGNAQVAACLGVPVSVINYNPPSADSPDFNYASTEASASDEVSVFPNEKILTEQYSLYSSARTPSCFAKAFNTPSIKRAFEKEVGAGSSLGTATAKWLAQPRVGDEATAFEMTLPFKYRGESFSISITEVTMVSKLLVAILSFTTVLNQPFPSSLETHLEKVTAQRLR